jgi:hypothetical protein
MDKESMRIESRPFGVEPTPVPQGADGRLPAGKRKPGESYPHYLSRMNINELKRAQREEKQNVESGKSCDEGKSDCAKVKKRADLAYARLPLIDAEIKRR